VIGCSRASADIVYAFGHGHLGLTLAAVTARLVAELIAGRGAAELLTPFAPGRFG
jgi:D-amino-acid dehydrogenase